MMKRQQKDYTLFIDNFSKAFYSNARLGVEVTCTSGGRNKFLLKIDYGRSPDKICNVFVGYEVVCIPDIGKLFNEKFPNFLLKPNRFMSLAKLINAFGLDKKMLASSIAKSLRNRFTQMKKWTIEHGAYVHCIEDNFSKIFLKENDSECLARTPMFKSFDELIVWVDSNVKS